MRCIAIMKSRSFIIFLALLALFFTNICGAALAAGDFNPKPLFSIAIGGSSPEMLGENTDESKILSYDRFYFPAAVLTSESQDRVFVLDSIKNRICAYSLAGKFIYEIKLPFELHPIDMAYYKDQGEFLIVYQQSRSIGAITFKETGNTAAIVSQKLLDIENALGESGAGKFEIQWIWPCKAIADNEITFLINAFMGKYQNILIGLKDDWTINVHKKDFSANNHLAGCTTLHSGMGLQAGSREVNLIYEGLKKENNLRHGLLKEFVMGQKGFKCRNIRPIGTDAGGNFYIEAQYGFSEDSVEKAYVYKFNINGRLTGKCESLISPAMLTNRFITIDQSGSIFYMQKNEKKFAIDFYKFNINGID